MVQRTKISYLDIDTIIEKDILNKEIIQNRHISRFFEILVKEHLGQESIDLSGKNCISPFDGICPNGNIYDAKCSALIKETFWYYHFLNKRKEDIEYFYLGAFNKDYTKLIHVWRVPGEIIEENAIRIGLKNNYKYNVNNMKEYEITEIFNVDMNF